MSEKIRVTAKTIEEALKKAQSIWKLDVSKNDYTIVQEPTKGIFGIGSKDAIIEFYREERSAVEEAPKAAVEKPKAPEAPIKEEKPAPVVEEKATEIIIEEAPSFEEAVEEATKAAEAVEEASAEDIGLAFLAPIFKALGTEPVVKITETDKVVRFDCEGNHVGILIGRHGETLNAIQFLLSLVINARLENHKGIIFDVENYRARQVDKLKAIAHNQAEKCRRTGRRVSLHPMSSSERRYIHLAIEEEPGVTSYSEGNEPHRRVVIVLEDQA